MVVDGRVGKVEVICEHYYTYSYDIKKSMGVRILYIRKPNKLLLSAGSLILHAFKCCIRSKTFQLDIMLITAELRKNFNAYTIDLSYHLLK